jgi:dTDP-4-amino-4,6-dideoxygalactose transaminase
MDIVSCKPTITRKDLEGVLDCLINDELVTGDGAKLFESSLCELTGYRHCVALSSHTAAYHSAFKCLDIGPGKEVIIPSFFSAAPLNALTITGGVAVIIDNAEGALSPDTAQIKEKITPNTTAIIVGHCTGIQIPMDEIMALGVPVIEDISHYIGIDAGEKKENPPAIMIASFTPFDLITTGNGAAIFTNNSRHFSAIKEMRFSETALHCDYVMTDFQAAMGLTQVSRLQDFLRRRREIAKVYYDALRHVPHKALYSFNEVFTYQSFPLIFDAPAEKVEKYWKKSGIEIHHPIEKPLHLFTGEKGMDYPNSDRFAKKVYSLPIYPSLTKKEIEKISRHLAKFI